MILLNPGPANTTSTVKSALVCPDMCPRETEFGDILYRISEDLVRVVGSPETFVAVLFCGSGTAAVEAALTSIAPGRGRTYIVNNGAYGQRMVEIADTYHIPHQARVFAPERPIRLEVVEDDLRHGAFTHAAFVHHETSTGMLNPLADLGRLCREHGVTTIVDAMSSYAGMPIDANVSGVDFLISSANKCLQGMAGLSFVICRREHLQEIERKSTGRSYYLDLVAQHDYFERSHQMRFTPPVQVAYALRQAIDELFAETVDGRYARYCDSWTTLQKGMASLGFVRLLPDSTASRILTSYYYLDHPRFEFEAFHDALYRRGFTIYPGKVMELKTFRLANMGAIDRADIEAFLSAVTDALREMGCFPLS